MKTSRCGFCYSARRQRERCERQGSSPRCCGVCVLIRLVLLRSFWHFPSTPAPVSLSLFLSLSVSASSPGLSQTFRSPTRLSSILCWHRQAAPSVTRLINSCSPILSATAGRACALSRARLRTSSESKFPMQRQPVYTCWHVLKGFFCCLYELQQLQDCLCLLIKFIKRDITLQHNWIREIYKSFKKLSDWFTAGQNMTEPISVFGC